jgi:5'(3')-deoxyribonucleotidase
VKIGVDIDGVLADFNSAFIDLVREVTGVSLPPVSDSYPDTWAYHRAGGVDEAGDNMLWSTIVGGQFFRMLRPLPFAVTALHRLSKREMSGDHVYYISTRPGPFSKAQSEDWLRDLLSYRPTVIISSHKGAIAEGLELDVMIDDKPENLEAVNDRYACCQTVLVDAPYNRSVKTGDGMAIKKRVAHILEAVEDL